MNGTLTERLEVRGISKSFGPVRAINNVSFSVAPGSIHGLVGENGAGKSTLVKIITGLERQDSGEILLDNVPARFDTPIEARLSGITAVYQDPKLFPHVDVAENIFMGIHPRNALGLVNRRRMYGEADRLLSELNVRIDPHSLIAGLSVADIQFVEIVRAMYADVKLLILDEPTSALTPSEAERLFIVVDSLRARGTSIIFISHRLAEVLQITDTVTVMRDGSLVTTARTSELTEETLVRHMVGRELKSLFVRTDTRVGQRPVLEVRHLSLPGYFHDVSFSIHEGEIVGLAGLVGAGRTEIAEAIFGIRPPASGEILVDGRKVVPRDPGVMLRNGVAYIPENRDENGLVTTLGVSSNICLSVLGQLGRAGFLMHGSELRLSRPLAEDLDIKSESLDTPVGRLSGGNRQKVVLAKWLATKPKVLILDEPTHGIDIATKSQVHKRISELAAAGFPVLLISSDLPEVLAMCDRTLVVAHGEIVDTFSRSAATQEAIMLAAVTGKSARTEAS